MLSHYLDIQGARGWLAYLLMWKYAIPVTYPYDFVVPQLGFIGLILARAQLYNRLESTQIG